MPTRQKQRAPYWDEHSLDKQRYYHLACLFYGANPDQRDAIAKEMELPDDRAEKCPEEFALADDSWGAMLEGQEPGNGAKGLRLIKTDPKTPLGELIAAEITDMNQTYGLPQWIDVSVANCGEANAFYDPSSRSITICNEYAEDLERIWKTQQ